MASSIKLHKAPLFLPVRGRSELHQRRDRLPPDRSDPRLVVDHRELRRTPEGKGADQDIGGHRPGNGPAHFSLKCLVILTALCEPILELNRGSSMRLVVCQQGLKWLIKGHSTFLPKASFNMGDIARRVNNQVEIAFRKLRSSILQIECSELDFQSKNQWKWVFTLFRKFKWTFRNSEYPKRPLNFYPIWAFWGCFATWQQS